jgi:hypothetical protein
MDYEHLGKEVGKTWIPSFDRLWVSVLVDHRVNIEIDIPKRVRQQIYDLIFKEVERVTIKAATEIVKS